MPTATVTPTARLPLSPGATMVPTLTRPGGEPSATGTPTGQRPLEGVAVGEVFDDGSAQPLPDVTVAVVHGATTVTDAGGRYALTAPAGAQLIELAKDGYTHCVRDTQITPGFAAQPLDARLTALGDPVTIGPDGGTVRATYHAPDGTGNVELQIPPNALSSAADIRLTVVSPQGLMAPLPRGWSVLLGIDVQPTPLVFMMPATLRVPLSLLASTASLPLTTAQCDRETAQWRKGPAAAADGDTVRIPLTSLGQLALAVPDTLPVAPSSVPAGDPLLGVLPFQRSWDAGFVAADPEVIPAGAPQSVHVLTRVHSLSLPSSGTLFEAQVRQKFDLRDGHEIVEETRRQDLIEYQLGPGVPDAATGGGSLHAYFTLVPSRTFALGELTQGLVTIDLLTKPAAPQADVIEPSGGIIYGDDGSRLEIPPNAVDRTTVVTLTPTGPDALPPEVKNRPDLVGAVEIQVNGGVLDPAATYGIGLSASFADGQRFVLARLLSVSDGTSAAIVGLGTAANGIIHFDACVPDTGFCLDGLSGSGTYVIFLLPSDTALLTGTVAEAGHARSGITVHSDTAPVVSESDANGRYLLPAPVGVTSTLRAHDSENDLDATRSVRPTGATVMPVDLVLQPSLPEVTQVDPPNHGANVATDATVTIAFSKPIAMASVTETSVLMSQQGTAGVTGVGVRLSLSADGATLLLTPGAALKPDALYRVVLTDHITDRAGNALTGDGPLRFQSDFTTAPAFTADALPPNTLRVSLPDDQGRVLVCGGTQLAAPGTAVVVMDTATGLTATGAATDRDGVSGSDVCDSVFSGRCDTAAPGSFCVVLDATLGDRIQLNVEDVLHNAVTLDAGNMRDEVTGTTAVGPEGGTVVAVADSRYRLNVPDGAFDSMALITLTPLSVDDFPHTADATLEFVGGVDVDLGGQKAAKELHLSVPAPADWTPDDQFVATQVVSVRGFEEHTVIDTASVDSASGLLTTNSPPFGGVIETGKYAMHRATRCLAWVSGFASTVTSFAGAPFGNGAFVPGQLELPFFLVGTQSSRFTVPVPCDEPVQLTLNTLAGAQVDGISLSTAPHKGEFIFLNEQQGEGLFADHTPPAVIATQTSIPNTDPVADDVAHDAEISVPFTKPLLPSSLTADSVKLICTVFGRETELQGAWRQSADGKRIFFVPRDGRPQRGLPFGSHCRISINGARDTHGNPMGAPFEMAFNTFEPTLISGDATVDARAIDSIGWKPTPAGLQHQFVVLAEGATYKADSSGGLLIVDSTTLNAPAVAAERFTAGLDRALRYVPAEDFQDGAGNVFHGPFLMSLDGIGDTHNDQRFGVWRLFDLSDFASIPLIASRIVNHSPDSFDHCNSTDPTVLNLCNQALRAVPNNTGIPLSVASVGAQVAYIADAPLIGVEAIQLAGIDRSGTVEGVDAILTGHYRSVETLKGWVIGARPDGLVISHPSLNHPSTAPDYPLTGSALALAALENWPVDIDGDGKISLGESFDLVVASSIEAAGRSALRVVAVDALSGKFVPQKLEGTILLPPGSEPYRIYPDPERRLLYIANGTFGLTIVDFQDPRGSLDDDLIVGAGVPNGIDDRVLGNVPLGGLRAHDVTTDVTLDRTSGGVDRSGHLIGYVAGQETGWSWVDLGPARMETRLVGYASEDPSSASLVEPAEVRCFNEHRTSLYQPEIKLPGHLVDLYPTVDVRVEAVDWQSEQPISAPAPAPGAPFPPVDMSFAPTGVTVRLERVPGTNRYAMPRDHNGFFTRAVVASNLPIDELSDRMAEQFSGLGYDAVYAGIGTKLKLTALVDGTDLAGKERTIPFEKLDVIVLGIDGLRQDVLYPPAENDVQEPGIDYHIDPLTLTGIGQVLGGRPQLLGGVSGNLDRHHLRMRGVSAVFPSITLASWASIFTGEPPGVTGILGNEFFLRNPIPGLKAQRNDGVITFSEGAFDRTLAETEALVPSGGATYFGPLDASETAQNDLRLLTAPDGSAKPVKTIFEQLREGQEPYLQALRERYVPDGNGGTMNDMSVMVFNHYMRGVSRWITRTDLQKYNFALTTELDGIPVRNLMDYLKQSFIRATVPPP
ncbi:MAG TPA: Ig-like domain-containing protein, partial [Candidatus Acidoferrales bacterium]|nr:Ig-like domain-containing protein [Candidatus Acidoferrales bacterium]